MLKHLEVFWEIHWPSLQKLIVSNCAHHWTFKTKAQKLTVLLFFQIRQLALRTRFSLSHQGEMYTFRKGPLVSPFLRILNQDVVGWKAGFFFFSAIRTDKMHLPGESIVCRFLRQLDGWFLGVSSLIDINSKFSCFPSTSNYLSTCTFFPHIWDPPPPKLRGASLFRCGAGVEATKTTGI